MFTFPAAESHVAAGPGTSAPKEPSLRAVRGIRPDFENQRHLANWGIGAGSSARSSGVVVLRGASSGFLLRRSRWGSRVGTDGRGWMCFGLRSHACTYAFTRLHKHPLQRPFSCTLVCSSTHSFILSFTQTHILPRTRSLSHFRSHSFTSTLIHSFTRMLMCVQVCVESDL